MIILAIIAALLTPAHLPACTTEDSVTNCHWDAATQGNGAGRSFIEYNGHTYYQSK